jgi:TonB-linked SusC/RagA family outer membrane protein
MVKKLLFLIGLSLAFACATEVRAQERMVSGRVTSTEDGSPLPGVNVVIRGTSSGTVTDAEGYYQLNVPSGGEALIFSFIGLQTREVPIGDRSTVDVNLSLDVTQLNEVVVTAGGIEQNKRDLGYAIQSVNSDAVVESRQSNLINGLSGKAAGVQVTSSAGTPGAAAQIRIRGGSSISGNNDPLFVIDGIPVDNSSTGGTVDGVNQSNRLVDFNPNDVESITVLKGPAATVQYGIRGSNGVVIVTTKKGARKQKASISFSSTTTIERVNKLPEMQTAWAQGRNGIYLGPSTGEATSWGPAISDLVFIPGSTSIYDKNGALGLASDHPGGAPAKAYDNTNTFFEDGITRDNFISISGGNEKSTVYVSGGYLNQNGIVPNSTFERYSFKVNADTKVSEKITVGAGGAYTQSGGQRIQQGSNLSGTMLGLLRTPPTFDNSNGFSDPANSPGAYTQPGVPATDQDNYQRSYRFNYDNPYWVVNKAPYRDNVNRFVGSLNATYKATEWLSITGRSGADYFSDFRKEVFDMGSKTNPVGGMNQNQISNYQVNHDLFANLEKTFNKLQVFATVGYNYFSLNRDRHRQVSTAMTIPAFFDISNFATTVNTNFLTRKQVHGAYGEARLTWNEMVFLNFSARNDWSSTLPKENNSIFYPSVSLGLDVTQAFIPNSQKVNYLKIRTSYGSVGNDAPVYVTDNYFARFAFVDGFTDGLVAPIRGQNAFVTNGILGNPNLKPELTSTLELGVDGSFFGDRLTLDYTYYSTQNNDLILPATIAASSGYYQTIVNTGTIERTGHEVVLGGTPVKLGNGFTWDVSINFTKYEAIVKELFADLDRTQAGFSGFVNYAVKGEAFPSFYGTRFLRDDNGKVVVDGTTGLPIQDDTDGALGSPIPDWQAGVRNTFSYKGFSLSALVDIKQGGLVWNGTKGVLRGFGVSAYTNDRTTTTIYPNSVKEDGTPNDIPIALGGQTFNRNYGFTGLDELNLEDGSYVRLRELSIGYNFPVSIVQKTKILTGASLSLVARNLFLITDYTGIDPETNLTGSSNDFGEDYFNMPNTKSIGFNVTLKF